MAEENMNKTQTKRAKRGPGPGGHGHGLAPGEKPRNFGKAIKNTLDYIGGYKFAVIIVLLFSIGATVFETVGPKVMGKATTELANGLAAKISGTGGIDFEKIATILLITIALYGIGELFRVFEGWIMAGVTQKVAYKMRRDICEKINRMPMKYFESVPYGEVLSRITNDVDTLGQGLNQSVTNIITAVTTIVGVIVMMLTISGLMTAIALIIVPLSLIVVAVMMKISQKHFRTQQQYLGIINGQVEENFAGQQVIKSFNKEEAITAEFDEANNILYSSAWKSQAISGLMMPLMSFVGNLGYVGVTISGAALVIKGKIGVGDIQAFIQYVKNLSEPMRQIAQILNQIQSMAAAAERVFEFLDEEEETPDCENPIVDNMTAGEVEFCNVKFGYSEEKIVINNFSAEVKSGQKIAIVGPTGAGKTTMVKLLMRFYDVVDGSIKLDGYDLREYSRKDLRNNFAMVLQDTWLFNGTIMENIRYGKPDASDEEVIAAAKAARADHFIRTLPDGYNMVLNEDATNISEGQRQLLTIARAILADKEVMILDEATSSVDTRTEERIQQAMDKLTENKTSFIIAHRLSTIKNADTILVMNHGDIVEQGSHEELLAKSGFYADLYNSQFEEV